MINFNFENSVEYDLYNSAYCKVIFERYDLHEQIYKSSLSQIFTIKDKFTEQLFTLKVVKKHKDIHFSLKDIKSIIHPRIAPVVNHGSSVNYLYIVKPYEEGMTLKTFIDSYGVLEKNQMTRLLDDLISIFDYLHKRSEPIIYRDLKPENIICKEDGHFSLIDILTCRTLKTNQNTDTFYVGTPGYASPEQYGYGQSDTKSDIYTIGSTLFFAATGVVPKLSEIKDMKETLNKSNCDKRIAQLILKCLQFDPDKRLQSTDQIRLFLNRSSLFNLIRNKNKQNRKPHSHELIQPNETVAVLESFHKVNVDELKQLSDEVSITNDGDDLIFRINHAELCYLTLQLNYSQTTDEVLKKAIYDANQTTKVLYHHDKGHRVTVEDKTSNYLVLAFDHQHKCFAYQRILASKLCDAGLIEFDNKYIKDIPLDHGVIVSTFRDELYLHISKDIMREELKHFKYVMIKSYPFSVTDKEVNDLHQLLKENPYFLREYAVEGNRSGPTPGMTCKETDWLFSLIDEHKIVIKTYKLHYLK